MSWTPVPFNKTAKKTMVTGNEICGPVIAIWQGTWTMAITIEDIEGGVTKVMLSGRLDIAGVSAIDLPLSVVGGSRRAVVMDLSGVEFMASLGLRSIIVSSKAIISKRGKVVLLAPQPVVEERLITSGVNELIPIYHNEAEAIAAVASVMG
jgi:anti-anti-sigma factor